jgi:phosphoglycerate dehydrogenase-like enzyme
VEYFFSTWGCPALTEEQIAGYFPNLKAVFYAAGSVQYFAHPFLRKGVRVFSANEANAAAVIDLTVAQIYLANKGYFQAVGIYRRSSRDEAKKYCSNFPGNEGIAAGVIGAGRIGGGVIERLKTSRLTVNVFDPFMDDRRAEKLKVRKCGTLEELFSSSFAITNHLADNEETKGILKYRHFSLMHDYGVFINTGRGAQVEEDGLVRALKEKPGRTALLDVTFPEPVEKGHPFYTMDNVFFEPAYRGRYVQ